MVTTKQTQPREIVGVFLYTQSAAMTAGMTLYMSEDAETLESPVLDYEIRPDAGFATAYLAFQNGFVANSYIDQLAADYGCPKMYMFIGEDNVPAISQAICLSDILTDRDFFEVDVIILHDMDRLDIVKDIIIEKYLYH